MLGRRQIAALIPHQGSMCLLEQAVEWDETRILCRSRTHLAADNPLRRGGRLGALCGIEYGLQAAALHGALRNGGAQRPGYFAALRDLSLDADRLDDPALGPLIVTATQELRHAAGLIYSFRLTSETGRRLVSGRATVMLT